MPKSKNVRLRTIESELQFAVQLNTTGKQLFEQVAKTIGLREVWYFGISYTNSKGEADWLKLSKKVIGNDFIKQDPIDLELKIKFYPEDAEVELIQEMTKRLFFLETKSLILSEKIYCDAPTCVLLASFACQVKYGNYHESIQFEGDRLLPESIINKHTLSDAEWAAKIAVPWKSCQDILKEDAMMQYIKVAQELDMFGVNYFDISNKKGTELLLGVDAQGLSIFEKSDKLSPRIGFPWSEIRNITYNDKKFILKSIDKTAPDFIFFVNSLRTNKRILSICMGNHELFMRRRREPTVEMKQLKAQVQNEMEAKQAEKNRQKLLRDERESIIQENKRLKAEMEQFKLKQQELQETLLKNQEEKEESEKKAKELEILKAKQEEDLKNLDEKRAKLEDELRQQREEFKIKSAEESEKINEQLRQMQIEKEGLKNQISATEMEQRRQKEQHQLQQAEKKLRGDLIPKTSVDESVNLVSVDMVHREPDANFVEPKQERKYGIQNDQIKKLSNDLAKFQKTEKITKIDIIAVEGQGTDKYKTLRELRHGNTRQRVEMFENLQ